MALTGKEEKLRSLAEMKKIIKHQQEHYQKVLTHLDQQVDHINEQIVEHDEEIAVLQERKAVVIQHFVEAPEQLIALARELREVEDKTSKLKTSDEDRVRKTARLKARIEKLQEKITQAESKTSSVS